MFSIFALFNVVEQGCENEHDMNEIQIIEQVIHALKAQRIFLEKEITYTNQEQATSVGNGTIKMMELEFQCLVENEINGTNLLRVEEKAKRCGATSKMPVLLVARYVQPTIYHALYKMGLNFADAAGNYHIEYVKGKKYRIQLSHSGEKAPLSNKQYPIFQEAGLKVIFYLLQDSKHIEQSFRTIKEHSGVSIGTVKNVIDELENRKFILTTQRKRVLKERRLLLDLWADNYHRVLKPKLLLKRLDFRTPQHREHWKELVLPASTLWGGECASNLLNGYLTPACFELYTEEPFSCLMKSGTMRTTEGDVYVYQKFWKGDTMPYPLIYADLVASGDSRCIEAANKLLENELSDFK